MYSMKDPNMQKISTVMGTHSAGGVSAGLGVGQGGGMYREASIPLRSYGDALNLDYLQGILKNMLAQAGVDRQAIGDLPVVLDEIFLELRALLNRR